MSNIDKHALREAAKKAQTARARLESMSDEDVVLFEENDIKSDVSICNKFIVTANPATVLALLDELEAKDNRINRLEAIVAVAEQRNALMREWKRALKVPCDLVDDQVPVVIHGMVIRLERLKETEEKLAAAEERIAELEAYAVEQWGDDAVALYSLPVDYIPACFTDERNLMHINERGRETSLIWSKQNSDSGDIQLFRIAAEAGKGDAS